MLFHDKVAGQVGWLTGMTQEETELLIDPDAIGTVTWAVLGPSIPWQVSVYVMLDGEDARPLVVTLPEESGPIAVLLYCPPDIVHELAFSVVQESMADSGVSTSGGEVGEYVKEVILTIGWHLPPTHLKSAPYAVVQELITK